MNSNLKIKQFMKFILLFLAIIISFASFGYSQERNINEEKAPRIIEIVPDKMEFKGDVVTKGNINNKCTKPWSINLTEGSIILGVDPNSSNFSDWGHGTAIARISLPDIYAPTLYVLKLFWPNLQGKGLHSPYRNRRGSILFNGDLIWEKRTTHPSSIIDYYAAKSEPILTTIVVTESKTYTLTFTVTEQTIWDLSKIELIPYPYPKTMKGIGYSPYRDCQYPDGKLTPPINNIEEDLSRLFHTCNAIRTYSATKINGKIPAIAKSLGLQVFAGAWLDGDREADKKEIQALIELANTINLDGLIVGNEYYLRHQTPDDIDYLLKCIIQVKRSIKNKNIPVTTAEVSGLMFNWKDNEAKINLLYRPIIDEIDFILVHIYPFWEGKAIDSAASLTVEQYRAIRFLIRNEYNTVNKRVVIGETGWPSHGIPRNKAIPSLENQKRYMLEFLILAEQEGIDFMYFDAFDELWKIEEPGFVGQNWGYSYSDRTAKHSFYGVLIPTDQLSSLNAKSPDIAYSSEQERKGKVFPVYNDWPMHAQLKSPTYEDQNFPVSTIFIPSGFMGDTNNISLNECERAAPCIGDMATKIHFSFTGDERWGGIYWLANGKWIGPGINIYNKLSVDVSSSIIVTFWARGESGEERVKFKVGGIGNGNDSIEFPVETEWITLTQDWKKYTIDLSDENLSNVVGGFCWVTDRRHNQNRSQLVLFVDHIQYEIK